MRGHVGALLGAHPLGALVAQVGGEPVDPRARSRSPGPTTPSSAGDHDVAGAAERAAAAARRGRAPSTIRPRPAATRAYDAQPPSPKTPASGRSGRCCRASARAAPRRPAATAARRRRRRSRAARTPRPGRAPPRAAGRTPKPSAASAIAGPTSVRRRIRRGRRPPRRGALEAGRVALEARVGRAAPSRGRRRSTTPRPPRAAASTKPRAPTARARRGARARPDGDAAEDRLAGCRGTRAGTLGRRARRRWSRAAHRGFNRHTAAGAPDHEGDPGPTLTAATGPGVAGRIRGVPDGVGAPRRRRLGAMTTHPARSSSGPPPRTPPDRRPARHPRRGPRPRPAAPLGHRPQGRRRRRRPRPATSTSTRSSCGWRSWCWSSSAAPA